MYCLRILSNIPLYCAKRANNTFRYNIICRHSQLAGRVFFHAKPPYSKCFRVILTAPLILAHAWNRFSGLCLRSKCLVCCQHIHLWSWMQALFWYPFHRWPVLYRWAFIFLSVCIGVCWRHTAQLSIWHTLYTLHIVTASGPEVKY